MKVAIVGATGLVGQEMIKVLESSTLKISEIVPLASERSVGKDIEFRGNTYKVKALSSWEKYSFDYALFSAGGSVSLEYAPKMNERGVVVIDNSSAFRMDENVPLVIPSVNKKELFGNPMLIANPNCSTIQLVIVLSEIDLVNSIKRVIVSTYQSVSGAGYEGIDELVNNTKSRLGEDIKVSTRKFNHNIDLNCIPHIDVFLDNLYTKEEQKMIDETTKIMGKEVPLTATCVRVPTITGHAESVNVECHDEVHLDLIRKELEKSQEIVIQDNLKDNDYPVNSYSKGSDKVFVGRFRKDNTLNNALNFWVVADNLRVGAASNAVGILEAHVKVNDLK